MNSIQILAALIFASLGVVFIVAFSKGNDPEDALEVVEVPASPAAIDHKKIMDSITMCTSIDQLRNLQDTVDRFHDLHWNDINVEVRRAYYMSMLEAISNKSRELYAQPVTV